MGTTLTPPCGISSVVATTCSRPWARRGPSKGLRTSEDLSLSVESRHGVGQVVGLETVPEHDRLAHALGQVLEQPARAAIRPVRIIAGEEQDLVRLHQVQPAIQLPPFLA